MSSTGRDMFIQFTTDHGNYGITTAGSHEDPGFYADWCASYHLLRLLMLLMMLLLMLPTTKRGAGAGSKHSSASTDSASAARAAARVVLPS